MSVWSIGKMAVTGKREVFGAKYITARLSPPDDT